MWVKSLCWIPSTSTVLYVNYISKPKVENKKKIIRIEVRMKDMGLDKITQKEKIKIEKMDWKQGLEKVPNVRGR